MPPSMQGTAVVSQSPLSRGHAGRAQTPLRDKSVREKPSFTLVGKDSNEEPSLVQKMFAGKVFGCEAHTKRPKALKRVLIYGLSLNAKKVILDMDMTGHYQPKADEKGNLVSPPDVIGEVHGMEVSGPLRTMDYYKALKEMMVKDPSIQCSFAGQKGFGNFHPM